MERKLWCVDWDEDFGWGVSPRVLHGVDAADIREKFGRRAFPDPAQDRFETEGEALERLTEKLGEEIQRLTEKLVDTAKRLGEVRAHCG